MNSPIRDVVSKYRSSSYLKKLIPEGSTVNSFLLFSGDLEFSLCESNRFVCAHTNNFGIYNFWDCAMQDPNRLYEILSVGSFSFNEERAFYILQDTWGQYVDPYVRSALFYYLNRCSADGYISCGAPQIFEVDKLSLVQLKRFKVNNFHIELKEVSDSDIFNSIRDSDCYDYYLIPAGKFSYNLLNAEGQRPSEAPSVDHKILKTLLEERLSKKIILVYKFHYELLKLYRKNKIIMIDKYGNLTNNQKKCEDLVVTNF